MSEFQTNTDRKFSNYLATLIPTVLWKHVHVKLLHHLHVYWAKMKFNLAEIKFDGIVTTCMYVCFFISQLQQHKSKHKNTIKAEKKKTVKNDIRCRTCKQSHYN